MKPPILKSHWRQATEKNAGAGGRSEESREQKIGTFPAPSEDYNR